MRTSRKIDRRGHVTEVTKYVQVRSERGLQWAGAPCGGFLQLYEEPAPNSDGARLRPSIPWDDSWEPGTRVDVKIVVTLVKAAPKSRKKCHNTWPAHVHDSDRERRAKRAARGR
jgi:hypothetical protein